MKAHTPHNMPIFLIPKQQALLSAYADRIFVLAESYQERLSEN